MELLSDPQAWISFFTLALLEIVLGVDNLIFLSVLVSRLPSERQARARFAGLAFAMFTRIALLFSINWLTSLQDPLFSLASEPVSGRDLILLGGGIFLVAKSAQEINESINVAQDRKQPSLQDQFLLIVLQIGIIDIVFSLDTVFTAIGLAQHIEVMVGAIVVSVMAMMVVSGSFIAFIERYPPIKILSLAFLILVGGVMIVEAFEIEVPKGYLYFALAFSFAVEMLNIRMRRRSERRRDGH